MLFLHRRHPVVRKLTGGARASLPDPFQAATGLRDPALPQQMCHSRRRSYIPWVQNFNKGSQPLPDWVADLHACPLPQTIRQLCRFPGMLNFYRRFLPDATATQAPLHALLASPRTKGSQNINWTPAPSQSLEEYRASLSRASVLAHPDSTAPIATVTDASTTAMGAVL